MENAIMREGAKGPAPATYILVFPDPDSPTAAPARYTDASLKSTLQLMGWKTRLAHKVALDCGPPQGLEGEEWSEPSLAGLQDALPRATIPPELR